MSSLKRTIKKGQHFAASSKGKPACWIVTRRIKTESQNLIYCAVEYGNDQEKKYTGAQFGYLLRTGIIRLLNEKGEGA